MERTTLPADEAQGGVRRACRFLVTLGGVLLLVIALSESAVSARPTSSDAVLSIPTESDWTDYGVIFTNGVLGEWDYQLWGGFTGTSVKREGTYYLYYQGASGYQTSPTEVVAGRAIGVATSSDGVNFTKSGSNPVVTWSRDDERVDEGPASGAVVLDGNGEIVLYYGANTAQSSPTIYADARLTTSPDGVDFTDQGIVLNHSSDSVWGYGDQLYPTIAFRDAGQWFVYYIPWGTPEEGKLGVAWGNDRIELTKSEGATSEGSPIQVFGMGGSAKIGPDTYALFLNSVSEGRIEARIMSVSAPNELSTPVETYRFDDVTQATLLLDEETSTWFMYYRSDDMYGVKLAPAGELDTTPPTAPHSVSATPVSDRQIELSWDAATDSETGVVVYKVFRDGAYLSTVKGRIYRDTGLLEQTEYTYQVSAVNYHGVEGPRSEPVAATTAVDLTPPQVVSVSASGPARQLVIGFNEPVEETSATTLANYVITPDISVTAARLNPDLRTVVLTTSEHEHLATYFVAVSGVRDRAESPNPIPPGSMVRYMHSRVPGLVGAWRFDEGEGETAFDSSNFGNDGDLIYTDKLGPVWTEGRVDGALHFDGVDDQVTIGGAGTLQGVTDQSHSFAAWALADTQPPNTTPNDPYYSVLVRNRTGLYYDYDGQFRAQIRLASGEKVVVTSEAFAPGTWHHLTMVVDDTNKILRLYVDGEEVNASPAEYSGSLASHEHAPYYVGTSDPLTGRYEYRFFGKIDEALIYGRALSALEAQSLSTGHLPSLIYLPVVMNRQ